MGDHRFKDQVVRHGLAQQAHLSGRPGCGGQRAQLIASPASLEVLDDLGRIASRLDHRHHVP
jgi:hypothetical protein